MNTTKRSIEILSAGCPACEETIKLVNENACPSCEIQIVDATKEDGAKLIKKFNIKSIPAVIIDGKLADCCSSRGPNLDVLKRSGLGAAN